MAPRESQFRNTRPALRIAAISIGLLAAEDFQKTSRVSCQPLDLFLGGGQNL